MRRLVVGLILTVLTGCGGAPSATISKADCVRADAAGVITISANRLKFSAPCMIAPAGTAFTIQFTNHQGLPHDVAIYDDASKVNEQFRGDTITGPEATIDYSIEALPAGEYYFNCTVHPPDMHGTLFVEPAP
jgi:Copper binding proteins, plastocyanin/azurin family.